ncbi:MAG: hypothetical protein M1838_002250 [Thelocarpon superellum]|nr:MAG: hypothetical protein M1838_002250 [Thelocarpon superellum]
MKNPTSPSDEGNAIEKNKDGAPPTKKTKVASFVSAAATAGRIDMQGVKERLDKLEAAAQRNKAHLESFEKDLIRHQGRTSSLEQRLDVVLEKIVYGPLGAAIGKGATRGATRACNCGSRCGSGSRQEFAYPAYPVAPVRQVPRGLSVNGWTPVRPAPNRRLDPKWSEDWSPGRDKVKGKQRATDTDTDMEPDQRKGKEKVTGSDVEAENGSDIASVTEAGQGYAANDNGNDVADEADDGRDEDLPRTWLGTRILYTRFQTRYLKQFKQQVVSQGQSGSRGDEDGRGKGKETTTETDEKIHVETESEIGIDFGMGVNMAVPSPSNSDFDFSSATEVGDETDAEHATEADPAPDSSGSSSDSDTESSASDDNDDEKDDWNRDHQDHSDHSGSDKDKDDDGNNQQGKSRVDLAEPEAGAEAEASEYAAKVADAEAATRYEHRQVMDHLDRLEQHDPRQRHWEDVEHIGLDLQHYHAHPQRQQQRDRVYLAHHARREDIELRIQQLHRISCDNLDTRDARGRRLCGMLEWGVATGTLTREWAERLESDKGKRKGKGRARDQERLEESATREWNGIMVNHLENGELAHDGREGREGREWS